MHTQIKKIPDTRSEEQAILGDQLSGGGNHYNFFKVMDMSKMNCWEFKKCGRQPGGEKTREFGVCPAALNAATDGINDGVNGGRSCWVITRTLCYGEIQGDFSTKLGGCLQCGFYTLVREEQGEAYINTFKILQRMNVTNSVAQSVRKPHHTPRKLRRTP